MKINSLIAGAVAAAALSVAGMASAEGWEPSGPVRMMIGFGAGGSTDSISRLLAQEIQERRGWEIIPENVPGRGGVNMGVALKDEPADGMSIGVTTDNSLAYNRLAERKPPYQLSDFTAITTLTGAQSALLSRSDSGWTSFDDLIAYAKDGNKVTLAADATRLADGMYLLAQANGFDFVTVKVDGGRAGMNAVMAGDVDVALAGGQQKEAVEAGDLVELLNINHIPLVGREHLPGMRDYNVDFTLGALFVVTAPAGIPDEAREAWADVIDEIIEDPNSQTNHLINRTFAGPYVMTGTELDQYLADINISAEKLLKLSSE